MQHYKRFAMAIFLLSNPKRTLVIMLNIPLLMIIAFVLLSLGVALRTKQPTTFREYAVGNKQFPTGYLAATVLATSWDSTAVINAVERIHHLGLYCIYVFISSCLCEWIISKLALRMEPYMQNLSMPETIGKMYGRYPRFIAAVASVGTSVFMIALQINAMSQTICMCVETDHALPINLLAACILILYATIGGVHAVTVTDILQIGTFCMVLPLLYLWIWMKTEKSGTEIIAFLQTQEKFQLSSLFQLNTKLFRTILSILVGPVIVINAPIVQRIYMSTNPSQASKVFRISGIANLFIALCIILISLFTFVATPKQSMAEIWPYIIAMLPPAFKGFVAISLLALSMSTADSYLNSSAVIFSHDIVGSIIRKKIAYNHQLRLAKLTTLFIGIASTVLSLYCNNYLLLTGLYYSCFIPTTVVPFILAVFGFRAASRTVLTGMATGIITLLAWNQWIKPIIDINGHFISMVANGLAIVIAHYLGLKTQEQIKD